MGNNGRQWAIMGNNGQQWAIMGNNGHNGHNGRNLVVPLMAQAQGAASSQY
jgi:hypothetical protein